MNITSISEMEFYHFSHIALKYFKKNYPTYPQYEPLEYLFGAEYPGDPIYQRQQASYKILAHIAHRMGFSMELRQEWYPVAEKAGLSQSHAEIILARIKESEDMMQGVEDLLRAEHS